MVADKLAFRGVHLSSKMWWLQNSYSDLNHNLAGLFNFRPSRSYTTLSMVANINTVHSADNSLARRRGYCDYPALWSFDYIQSIKGEYAEGEGAYASQHIKLKDKVRMTLKATTDPLVQLENIDILQRLGIYYHFEDEIKNIMEEIYNKNDFGSSIWKNNLYATALKFRILRQHLYSIPQEIFNDFKDESGMFKECDDTLGLLSLYEASFLLMHGENILEEAREFSSKHLQEFVKCNENESYLSILVGHALEVPLHWRVPRFEAKWFIDIYRRSHESMNPTFLELSILDYNILQSIYQEELRELSRWWRKVGLSEKMKFARERVVENALVNVAMVSEPQYGYCRTIMTKVYKVVSVMDDVYDVYGTLDELERFTTALESWDINAMDRLPDYMKLLFLAVFNVTNELAYDILKEQGFHVAKYLKQLWVDLGKAFMQEAKWYHTGTRPATLLEYMENACVSVGGHLCLVMSCICVTNPITEADMELLMVHPSIIRQFSLILRLTNDLVTDSFEKKNGDVPTSIRCHMYDTGISEDAARKHIYFLVNEAWKQLNEDRATNSAFSRTFVEMVTNISRMAMWTYDGKDGYGIQNQCMKECASSLFVNPISFGVEEQEI